MSRTRSFLKLTRVELKLFLRDPFATVFTLVLPLIMLLLLAAVFGDTPAGETENGRLTFRGVPGADYYMTASIVLVIAAIGLLTVPIHLAGYREVGILRRFRASSIPAWALFGSQIAVALAVATVGSLVMLLVAKVVYQTQSPESIAGVLVAFIAVTLCFAAVGFLLASLVPTARATQGISLILFFLFWMLSGTGPPRAVLPDSVRTLTDAIPLTHALIAIQDPWYGLGWNWVELGILAAFTVGTAIPALVLFNRNSES